MNTLRTIFSYFLDDVPLKDEELASIEGWLFAGTRFSKSLQDDKLLDAVTFLRETINHHNIQDVEELDAFFKANNAVQYVKVFDMIRQNIKEQKL